MAELKVVMILFPTEVGRELECKASQKGSGISIQEQSANSSEDFYSEVPYYSIE